MDLGLELEDDDIFHFQRERNKVACDKPYTVKLCPPLWFDDVDLNSITSDNTQAQTILKFRGDRAYQDGKYETALEFYSKCQEHLQPNNISMRRGVEEDKARCYLRLQRLEDAIFCAEKVAEMAQNFEQVTDILQLFLNIYQVEDNDSKISSTLKKLLLLHPNNFDFWFQLGNYYFVLLLRNSDKDDENIRNFSLETKDVHSIEKQNSHHLKWNDFPVVDQISKDFVGLDISTKHCCNKFCQEVFGERTHHSSSDITHVRHFNFIACMTCYMASSLLLKYFLPRQNSFAESRNKQLQMKVNSQIDQLQTFGIENLQTKCSDFLRAVLNLNDAEESNAQAIVDDMTPRFILYNDETCEEAFVKKWFLWLKESNSFAADQCQQLNDLHIPTPPPQNEQEI